MTVKKFPPMMGMDNVSEDAAMERHGDDARLYLRDAINVDLSETGRIDLRKSMELQSTFSFKYLWQSDLHGDCFALLNDLWVKVNTTTWEYEVLMSVGVDCIYHKVVNNHVYMSCKSGLYVFDGVQAQKLTIATPAKPMIHAVIGGAVPAGEYTVAISWLRGAMESALSELSKITLEHSATLEIQLPYCMDDTVTHVRIYVSEHNGGELRHYEDVAIDQFNAQVLSVAHLTRAAQFQFLSPMKSGKFLQLWRGRILTAQSNVLYFSEAMAFHLTDERYNFIQLPERITFVEAVDGGIWVGLKTHVVFLRGQDIRALVIEHKATRAPVAESSLLLNSDESSLGQGGAVVAVWLADNGFVLGTADGQVMEVQSDHLKGISGKSGQAVRLDKRLYAVVN